MLQLCISDISKNTTTECKEKYRGNECKRPILPPRHDHRPLSAIHRIQTIRNNSHNCAYTRGDTMSLLIHTPHPSNKTWLYFLLSKPLTSTNHRLWENTKNKEWLTLNALVFHRECHYYYYFLFLTYKQTCTTVSQRVHHTTNCKNGNTDPLNLKTIHGHQSTPLVPSSLWHNRTYTTERRNQP